MLNIRRVHPVLLQLDLCNVCNWNVWGLQPLGIVSFWWVPKRNGKNLGGLGSSGDLPDQQLTRTYPTPPTGILFNSQYLNQHFSSFLENLLCITQSLEDCLPPAVFIIASCKVCFMELSQRKKICRLNCDQGVRGPSSNDFSGSTVPGSH